MDNEEEDVSKLPSSPPIQLQHDDSADVTATTTVTNSHDDGERRGFHPQCDVDSGAEVREAQNETSEREGQLLEDGREGDEDSIRGVPEVVAELGVEGDESRGSRESVSTVAAAGENGSLMSGADLAVVAARGGEEERQVGEMKEKVGAAEEEREIRAYVADEMERKVEMAEDRETNADLTEEKEIRTEVAAEMEEGFEMGEETGIMAIVMEETEIRTEVVEEAEIEEAKGADVAGETEIADEITAEVAEKNGEEGEMLEGTGIEVEEKKADVTEETEEKAEMVEKTNISDYIRVVDAVMEETGIPEEMGMANIATETAIDDDAVVATAADGMEVGDDVAEEKEMQEETEFTDDVAGGETEMCEETEMQEETEYAEEDTEMDDRMEEANADVAATEKADMTEEKKGEESEEVAKTVGGKRKRGGKNAKPPGRVPSRKKSEEDVCFICFDGGELVLCDRRGCPKAYHPACVNRDEAFFRAKGRWNCGWHLCSICEKNASYMCFTCTFSLCKGCIKDAVIFCVRNNKGFCETCMKTVMLIERNQQGNKEIDQVDFDDRNSWEYLFKDYWLDLKGRLSLSLDEIVHAKNPWKGSDIHAGKQDSPDELYEATNDGGHGSDSSSGNAEMTVSKRRKTKRRPKSHAKEGDSSGMRLTVAEGVSTDEGGEWASKELLELVMHMRNGDKSVLSQFDVQTLLLDYIKKYKLRDPHRRTHVICDSRLQNLFGKPRVGHFEMLKLLESHFLTKEDSQADDLQGSVVDTETSQLDADGNSDVLIKGSKDKKRKSRKKGDERGFQSNLDDYAAIDMHNINLIYLRRNLVEELLEDNETFQEKVVGSFVRIRISGSVHKQDLYRLVQVVGTSKVAEPYRVGKRMTDILLEILNLNKTEVVSIDIISNQEFTEDECKRLRQSIKCGLINRLTVGDIQEKAMALQAVRVKDWMESETLRLSHLRDRASDMGRRKELRECVEKLQLLKTPEERQRRLEDIPEIHSDPNMDPSYESDEDEGETDYNRQESYMRPRGSGFSRRGRDPISPGKGGPASNDSYSGTRNYSSGNKELSRNVSNKGFFNKGDDFTGAGEIVNENLWNQARDTHQMNSWEKPRTASNLETSARNLHSTVLSESISRVGSEISLLPGTTSVAQSAPKINESEKIWHYQDPSGKVQGPFSMVQLRKWSNTGYFPSDLRIWKSTEKQDDSILLTDALAGKFTKDPPMVDISLSQAVSYSGKHHGAPLQQGMESQVGGNSNFEHNRTAWNPQGAQAASFGRPVGESWKPQPELSSSIGGAPPSLLEVPKIRDGWGSETSLPSPTPSTAIQTKGKTFEREWSPTPVKPSGSLMISNQFPGGNGGQQLSTVLPPESGQLTHSSTSPSSSSKLSGNLDGFNMSRGVSSASKPEAGESHRILVSHHQLPATNSVVVSMNPAVDMKNMGASLQSLVQPLTSQIAPVETHGWGSSLVARHEMVAPSPRPVSVSQSWGNASSQTLEQNNPVPMPAQSSAFAQPHASSFSTGNPSGVFPAPSQSGVQSSDSWRPSVPGQSNIQPSAQPNLAWGMGVSGNQTAMPRQGLENQNSGWGPIPGNPSMGWGGQIATSTNMSWGAPGQTPAPANANSGWAAPGQGQAPGNGIPGWVPPGQGLAPSNANPGWGASGQGPPPGNANPGWGAPGGNPAMWGSEQNNNGDRYSSQRERTSQGGDSGYGGGRPWNRPSSFGSRGDSSRPPFNKGQRVCKFHESGHCKKGSQCDYLHS